MKLMPVILLLVLQTSLFADDHGFNQAMQDAQNAYSHIQDSINKSHLSPSDIPHYTNNPKASQYANNPQSISGAAMSQSATNDEAQAINQEFDSGKDVAINGKDPAMQHSAELESDANAIVHGQNGQYIHCNQTPQCTTSYTTQTCTTEQSRQFSCNKVLTVDVEPRKIDGCYHTVLSADKPASSASALATLMTGGGNTTLWKVSGESSDGQCTLAWLVLTDKSASATRNFTIPYAENVKLTVQGWSYFGLQSNISSSISGFAPLNIHAGDTASQSYSVPKAGSYQLNLSGQFQWFSFSDAYAVVTAPYVSPIEKDTWTNSCDAMSDAINSGFCQVGSWQCTGGSQTREINGINVTRSCWGYQSQVNCGSSTPSSSCQGLINQGCSLQSRACTKKIGNFCLESQDTYSCAHQKCQGTSNICGGDVFCVDGNCYEKKPSQSTASDFAKAGSEMAAASNAADDASKGGAQNPSIYSGRAMSCGKDFVGFSDCCRNSGWGKDIHLAHCSQEEKELGLDRQKGYAIGLGEYCSHHTIFGICTAHREAFCVFQGVLARIIQKQGRLDQLGIGFGSDDSPNCRGLTVNELGKIDFSRIDFSDYYKTVENGTNLPDPSQVKNHIINNLPEGGK